MPKRSARQNGRNEGVTRCFLVRAQAMTEPPQADEISKPKAYEELCLHRWNETSSCAALDDHELIEPALQRSVE